MVRGGFGAGKTAALVARWKEVGATDGFGRVVYVARTASAVADVRRRLLAAIDGEFPAGPLSVTTWTGLALDIARRAVADDLALVAGAAQSRLVAELFANESPDLWPNSQAVFARRAFPQQLAAAVRHVQSSTLTDAEIAARATAAEVGDRWDDLLGFVGRYRAALTDRNAVDVGGVVGLATQHAASLAERVTELIVDDAEALSPPQRALLDAISAAGVATTLAYNPDGPRLSPDAVDFGPVTTDLPPAPEPAPRLVLCRHPSIEADAIVGELVAANADGVAWHDMAVVVPHARNATARSVVRALGRRGLPVRVTLADRDAEPVVASLCAALHDAPANELLVTALEAAVATALGELRNDDGDFELPPPSLDRALDALVAFERTARAWIDAQPRDGATVGRFLDAYAADEVDAVSADIDDGRGVAVVGLDAALGRRWQVAVVAGCVEGQYPSVNAAVGWFDPAITQPAAVPTVAQRRRDLVANERRRFAAAASRAPRVSFVAAPQPGVLISRYVEHLPISEPSLAWPDPTPYQPLAATVTSVGITPDGVLRLSASQLSTYEDCPRKWFYDNALRLSDSTSVWADFGTLVHDILEVFLAPAATTEYSLEALLDLADEKWTDDIATFAPQRTQARRELRDVLTNWWVMEGADLDRDLVVDVEVAFDVAVGPHRVRGRIDRVDRDPSRDGLSIIDYKTSARKPQQADVDANVQLAIYYLAALRTPELAAVGAPVRLELVYPRLSDRFEQPITDDHAARAEERILAAAEQMLREDLDPLPTADCDHCDYHRLCPLQRAGREVGATR